MKPSSIAIALLLELSVAATASAQDMSTRLDAELGIEGGLTSDDAARRAQGSSPEVEARRAEVLQTAASVDEALIRYAPTLRASARYARLSNESSGDAGTIVVAPGAPPGPLAPGTPLVNAPLSFSQPLNQYTFQASLIVPISDYILLIPHAHAAAGNADKAARWSQRAAERKASTDARLAYYGWVRARLQTIVAEQAVEQARDHVRDGERAAEVGNATKADVLALEAQLAQAELLAARSRELTRVTEARLRILMHAKSSGYRIGEDVRAPLAPLRLANPTREALRRRAELRALDAHIKALESSTSVEEAMMYPRLEGFATGTYANPNQRVFPQEAKFRGSWEVGAQLTWTVNDVPRGHVRSRRVAAEIRELRAERAQLADAIENEIESARSALREAEAALRVGKRRLVAAEEAYRVRRMLFSEGLAKSVELTDAETSLTQARLEVLNAHVDQRVARVRVLHAIGRSGS